MNYKAPLNQALKDAGFRWLDFGIYTRQTFTHLRKNGQRRIKIWIADDIFEASYERQVQLERMLKFNYGEAYLGGYFISGPRGCGKSFCVVLDQSKLKD